VRRLQKEVIYTAERRGKENIKWKAERYKVADSLSITPRTKKNLEMKLAVLYWNKFIY